MAVTTSPYTIVVVEDDGPIRRVVEGYLQQAGYRVLTAADGVAGLALVEQEKPALLVLDLMLPGLDGWALTRRLRSSADPALAGLYIIMLTARVEEADRVQGLELGADDYVPKPFSPRELVARVRAALRRLEGPAAPAAPLRAGDLLLEPAYRRAALAGQLLELTTTEFDLLCYLMRHPGRPFTRGELLDALQSDPLHGDAAYERTIDVHIKNIRHKLGDAGRNSRFIETVHGVGYRFLPQS
ncbi:MAG TPA: response regulator transcription factor [Caldilineaceae bacterium]|nr:response regulator transcription factor [Caldilineaceae bacterium]